MIEIHLHCIDDATGETSLLVLPALELKTITEEFEELDDIRLYDEAKNEDTGERMLFSDYLSSRETRHAQLYNRCCSLGFKSN